MGEIRVMEAADWSLVRNIYAAGIAGGQATFEITPPDWEHFDSGKLAAHRFVAVEADRVVGWVAASGVSDRCVYRGWWRYRSTWIQWQPAAVSAVVCSRR